jgi:hypothetical protein
MTAATSERFDQGPRKPHSGLPTLDLLQMAFRYPHPEL